LSPYSDSGESISKGENPQLLLQRAPVEMWKIWVCWPATLSAAGVLRSWILSP